MTDKGKKVILKKDMRLILLQKEVTFIPVLKSSSWLNNQVDQHK